MCGSKSAAKYKLCRCRCRFRCRCRCESTIWWGKRLAPPSSLSSLSSMALRLSWPLSLLRPLSLLWPLIRLPHPLDPVPLRPPLPRNCWLPRTLLRFRNCVGCASAKLQFHRRILAFGLTERLVCANDEMIENILIKFVDSRRLPASKCMLGIERFSAKSHGILVPLEYGWCLPVPSEYNYFAS